MLPTPTDKHSSDSGESGVLMEQGIQLSSSEQLGKEPNAWQTKKRERQKQN